MACDGISDIVVRESGRYMPGAIYRRTFGRSFFFSHIRRDVFPGGIGEIVSNLTYERDAPDVAEPTWTAVTVNDGSEGGACLPPVDRMDIGSTTRSFQIYRRALEGPYFCAEEMRSAFEVENQLNKITDAFAARITLEWDVLDQNEYFKYTQTKVVVNDCQNPTEDTTMAETYPAACPTQVPGLGLLEKYRIRLLREGAGENALAVSNGRPLLTVYASEEFVGNIIRQNADIREDIRNADSGKGDGSRLLQAFGVSHSYGGFMFVANMWPRRFTCSGGTYTQVPRWVKTAATKGRKATVNPAWLTAPYEELDIFDPTVFIQRVPDPVTNPAPGYKFDPISYVGNIKAINEYDKECNPDKNQIYHRAVLAAASEVVHPERGVAMVYLRCDPACGNSAACGS